MEQPLPLVPEPRAIERRGGHFVLSPDTLICLPPAADEADLLAARQLQAEIAEATGLRVHLERQERPHRCQNTIVLLRASRDGQVYPPA